MTKELLSEIEVKIINFTMEFVKTTGFWESFDSLLDDLVPNGSE